MQKPLIALFLGPDTVLDVSPSLLNLVPFLGEHYGVHIFSSRRVNKNLPCFLNRDIAAFCLSGVAGSLFGTPLARRNYSRGLYRSVLSIDASGFLLAKSVLPETRPFYYSMELSKDADPRSRLPAKVAEFERRHIHSIRGLIIQSREREQIFREDFGVSEKTPALILPVTYTGPSVTERNRDLAAQYGIPDTSRIAVHVGGIAWWSWCVEVAQAFGRVDDWSLVFHGYTRPSHLTRLRSAIQNERLTNVIISRTCDSSIDSMYPVLQTGEVGIAWYEDISPNMRTSVGSSGKIAAYLKFGLPVVVKTSSSARDVIERPGVGVCIDCLADLPGALDRIETDYQSYSDRARLAYERTYRFENYHSSILDFLQMNE